MEAEKFQGETLEEAVEAVRERWGPSAVILHVERITKGGFLGLGKNMIEVTARPERRLVGQPSADEAALGEKVSSLRNEVLECRTTMQQMESTQRARSQMENKALQNPLLDFMVQKGLSCDYALELLMAWTASNPALDLNQCIDDLDRALPRLEWNEIFPADEGRCTLMLGLPGSGKTLLLLKIAARMKLLQQANVHLVSADMSRPGPSEQLALYSEVLKVPLTQVFDLSELKPLIEELPATTHLLVDWNGFSPYQSASWQPLELVRQYHPHFQVLLTASMASDLRNWEEFRPQLASLPIKGLALTQADLEHRLGKVWEASRGTKLPVAFFSTGKNVPGDVFEGKGFPFGKHFFRGYTAREHQTA